jgi:hypothetical protein
LGRLFFAQIGDRSTLASHVWVQVHLTGNIEQIIHALTPHAAVLGALALLRLWMILKSVQAQRLSRRTK